MKKILYYGMGYNKGGIETYLLKICTRLNKQKYEIFFIDETGGHAAFRKELEKMGVVFYDITPRRKSVFANKRDLKELFSSNKFDILHFNCNSLSYIEPIKIALKNGVNVIVHSRNSKANKLSTVLHNLNFKKINPKVDDNVIKRIAVSKIAGNWMFGDDKKFIVLNNGVDTEQYRFNIEKRIEKREELGIDDRIVFGNVGAFLEAKNHEFIVSIFERLVKMNPNSVLLLIGIGPLKYRIEQRVKELGIEKNVVFLESRDDVADLYMAMDCLIFPSLYEGFPNVVLEAQTAGLPIVMSSVITDEVMISNNCISLSLQEPIEKWVEEIIKITNTLQGENITQRNCAYLEVEKAGYSVVEEIKKIENIYDSFNTI